MSAFLLLLRSLALEPAKIADWQLVAVAALLNAIAGLWRVVLQHNAKHCADGSRCWGSLVITPGMLLYSLWLSTFNPGMVAAIFIWVTLLASELFWTLRNCPLDFADGLPQKKGEAGSSSTRATVAASSEENGLCPSDDDLHCPLDEDVDQLLKRRTDGTSDQIHGLLRVRFEPGQRIATAYAAFAPPLLPSPTAEAEVVWGSEADVTIVDIHGQGIELEVRRESVDDGETSSIMEFFACSGN
ncbi:MAG: hypothetical protein R3C05_01700 [Pirellulaceae bacterium]